MDFLLFIYLFIYFFAFLVCVHTKSGNILELGIELFVGMAVPVFLDLPNHFGKFGPGFCFRFSRFRV